MQLNLSEEYVQEIGHKQIFFGVGLCNFRRKIADDRVVKNFMPKATTDYNNLLGSSSFGLPLFFLA